MTQAQKSESNFKLRHYRPFNPPQARTSPSRCELPDNCSPTVFL